MEEEDVEEVVSKASWRLLEAPGEGCDGAVASAAGWARWRLGGCVREGHDVVLAVAARRRGAMAPGEGHDGRTRGGSAACAALQTLSPMVTRLVSSNQVKEDKVSGSDVFSRMCFCVSIFSSHLILANLTMLRTKGKRLVRFKFIGVKSQSSKRWGKITIDV